MKIYNVNLYMIHQHKCLFDGSLKLVGNALIEKRLISASELISGRRIKVVSEDTPIIYRYDPKTYEKYGYVLAVRKEELTKANLASNNDIIDYLCAYPKSKASEIISKMNENYKEYKKNK